MGYGGITRLLDFFSGRNIEVTVELSNEQDSLPCPRYEVKISNGGRGEFFIILGDPESGHRLKPEDALRSLLIRIRMHENSVCCSSPSTALQCETAARLKDLLGNDVYCDFLNMPIT